MSEIWVIVSGISANHDPKFVGLKTSRDEAVKYANELSNALYPGVVIETRKQSGDGIGYYHPQSNGGDNIFIRVFRYNDKITSDMLKFYRDIHELNSLAPKED